MKNLLFSAFFILFATIAFAQEGVKVEGNSITVKEIAPVWPGCEKLKISSSACFNQMVAKHIKENYKFPKDKDGNLVRGKTTISFVVNEKGQVTNVVANGDKKPINDEATRIVKLIPKMTPAKSGGKAISKSFKMPFTF